MLTAVVVVVTVALANGPADAHVAHRRVSGPVTDERRAEAATASGLTTFVGLSLGALGTPLAIGVTNYVYGGPLTPDTLLLGAVAGGSIGAAVGGALGALTLTTPFTGPLIVGAVAGASALAGLVPAVMLGRAAYHGNRQETNDPLLLAHSGAIALAIVVSSGGAAIAGAIVAE